MRHAMKHVLVFLAACGSASAPVSAPSPTPAPRVAPAPADPGSSPAPAQEAPPDENAPATPSKVYDAKQCKQRVETFEKRVMAAYEHSNKTLSLMTRTLFVDRVDPDVTTPTVVVWFAGNGGMEGEWCGTWMTEIVVNGKTVATNEGKQRNAKTLDAVKKRLAKGGVIGLHIGPDLAMDTIEPLLIELQKLGPLALSVGVPGSEFAVAIDDAPAWARERYRAYKKTLSTKILSRAIRDAVVDCPAHKAATEKVVADTSGNTGWVVAKEYPKAVAACACRNIDVDALELFTVAMLEGGYKSVSEGFLELKIDPASPTKIAAPTSQPFATELGKRTRGQRRDGVALDTHGAPAKMARCK